MISPFLVFTVLFELSIGVEVTPEDVLVSSEYVEPDMMITVVIEMQSSADVIDEVKSPEPRGIYCDRKPKTIREGILKGE